MDSKKLYQRKTPPFWESIWRADCAAAGEIPRLFFVMPAQRARIGCGRERGRLR